MTAEQCCLHPGGLAFTEKIVQEAEMSPASKILDAGCGAGNTVMWLREQGYDARGIDKHSTMDVPWIQQGTLQKMPYKNGSFDAVISECTAFICGDTESMLKECYRVLCCEGLLLLADVYFKTDKPLPQFMDNRPVTLEAWQKLLAQCGFEIIMVEDVSEAWKPFVIEQLWAGRTLEDLCGGCMAEGQASPGQYKPGYFLLRARKRSEQQ